MKGALALLAPRVALGAVTTVAKFGVERAAGAGSAVATNALTQAIQEVYYSYLLRNIIYKMVGKYLQVIIVNLCLHI